MVTDVDIDSFSKLPEHVNAASSPAIARDDTLMSAL
jgi:hypothetical protein